MEWIGLLMLSIFAGLKTLGSLQYRGGAAKFFFNNWFKLCNYSYKFMLMHIMKSTARREHMVAASSSSSEDNLSLGADQEVAPTPTHDAASSSVVS
jgi:hypothetical protein